MTAAFNNALRVTLRHEGRYVNHPKDPGGATMYGITERVARAHGYVGDMRVLPLDTAAEIYRISYWDKVRGDELPPALAGQVFDAAVNHGVKAAVTLLQRTVGTAQDGIIGPATLKAAKAAGDSAAAHYLGYRLKYYTSLSTWGTFGRGWTNRVAEQLLSIQSRG